MRRQDSVALPGWTPSPSDKKQRILYFTRTVGFEHSVVHREARGDVGDCARPARQEFQYVGCDGDGSILRLSTV